ncbi:type I secretion system permease/ATPase [Sphingomonas carotinifaciens]|uniref:ATP-binding cassette, subfamily C n=1 Tax=Sphingomonas carotinifaciens TaxID=1166323 RepID=A0A1G7RVN0_9SPHN|nr:type I secretion system permease/ATPase [Sphingomonas carotinifaciens]MBB4088145.1 ATP-binding cassette subfamily C protein [Sphingomonas carotinifaciens]MWC44724.1 type I secretion system permease/ATPase [Sphingomonas carotinifaciens]SDG14754.1 ATP-binding cassette, subfamily C [Sphingomonas carotinifaciens]
MPLSSNPNPVSAALRGAQQHFLWAAAFSGLVNLLYLVPSIFMLQVYDRVVPTRGGATLVFLIVILIVALAVLSVLDMARMRLLLRASVRLEKRAAPPILHRILGATTATPAERSAAIRHLDTLRGVLTGPAILALFDAPWAPIYIAVCFLLHPLLGGFALLASVLLAGVALASEQVTKRGAAETQIRSAAQGRLQDYAVQAAEVGRVLGMRGAIVRGHLERRADVVTRQGALAETSGAFLAVTKFLRQLFQSLALALGAWLAIHQSISMGAIFAASLLVGRALAPVEQILGSWKNVLSARASYAGLAAFLRLPDATAPRTALPRPRGAVTVAGVSVRAPGSDRMLLSDVSFDVSPGEIVALIGPSGAGKSTLLRVVASAISPDRGEVRIDGTSLADWDREALGACIGYTPQAPTLFPATVTANIARFASPTGDAASVDIEARVVAAAMRAGAHETIQRFANGYNTPLTIREAGGLSAGQRQLVSLSRALFGDPSLLLLDEPNAHLDLNGEAALMKTLASLRAQGVAVLLSTHRPSLLQVADRMLLVRDGTIVSIVKPDPDAAPRAPGTLDTARQGVGA